ncbi:hypothetical protein VN97_g72 [Penicillium thymicola]|uniref:BTB domain-containing protein n=1 Tax=Penicillium thymicola TaxID=293382 RepID=A0AAI9XDD1_PENTH|nr:hypothetical protein VN97_g72 [Penicillium thymicola]
MSTPADIQDVMRDLLLRGQFSDMEIIRQRITFKVHRAIVCTQSKYFNSAICDGFKDSTERSIRIREDTPETIERVLSYLHHREYDDRGTIQYQTVHKPAPSSPGDKTNDTESTKNIALNNMRVFITANKFGIDSLQSSATQKFSRWAAKNWNSPVLVFPEVIQEVVASVPSYESSLQEVILDIIVPYSLFYHRLLEVRSSFLDVLLRVFLVVFLVRQHFVRIFYGILRHHLGSILLLTI